MPEQQLSAHETVIANHERFNGSIPMPKPGHSGDADEMVPPQCECCNGHGMVGGLSGHPDNAGYESEPCPFCTKPEQQEAPECRLVGYAKDGSACTLNLRGDEIYFDRITEQQEAPELTEARYLPPRKRQGRGNMPMTARYGYVVGWNECLDAIAAHEAKRGAK